MDGAIEFTAVAFRFWLAAVFVVAGLSKLGKRQQFERAVVGYGLLPPGASRVVAAGLPPVELAGAVLIAAGLALPAVAAALFLLLSAFTLAVGLNLARGRRIDCGCFGSGIPREITWATVLRNVALAAMAATVVLAAPRALAVEGLLLGPSGALSHSAGLAALVASTAVLAAVALGLNTSRLRPAVRRTSQVVG